MTDYRDTALTSYARLNGYMKAKIWALLNIYQLPEEARLELEAMAKANELVFKLKYEREVTADELVDIGNAEAVPE
jgi:hypothetical protein